MSKYSALVQWSEGDKGYIAIVPELPGLSAFGSSEEEAVKELSIAKKAYLEVLEEDGEEVPQPDILKPFSGQTRLRLPKSLHASLSNGAKRERISLNTYIINLLSEGNALSKMEEQIASLKDIVCRAMLSMYPSRVTAESGQRDIIIENQVTQWGAEDRNEDSR